MWKTVPTEAKDVDDSDLTYKPKHTQLLLHSPTASVIECFKENRLHGLEQVECAADAFTLHSL